MPFEYVSFDGVDIPRYNRESDLSTPEAVSGFVPSIAGGFNSFGSAESPTRFPIPLACNGWILEATPGLTEAAFHSLRSRWRAFGTLIRRSDTGQDQSCEARLMHINQVRGRQNHNRIAFNLSFDGYSEWRGLQRTHTQNLAGSPITFATLNDGNRTIGDAVLTIEAGADVIRTLTLTAGDTHLIWDGVTGGSLVPPLEPGRINPGETLVWRMGSKSIRWSEPNESGAVDGYYGLTIGANHAMDDWLHIPPGGGDVVVAYTKGADTGSGTARLEYYEGWK